MKKVWNYFLLGCVVAIGGMFFSEICGSIFNGMDYGSACLVGMGMYLCVVIVTCTGIIISKISTEPNESTLEEKEN